MDGSGYKGLTLKTRRPAAHCLQRAENAVFSQEPGSPTAAGCWHISKYSVGAGMTELKTSDAEPTDREPTLWLPEPFCTGDSSAALARPPVTGSIIPDDDGSGSESGLTGSAYGRVLLAEAGWSQRLNFRLEALFLGLRDFIGHELAREKARGSGFNFLPVAMAGGIALFYSAPGEPSILMLAATTVVFALAAGLAGIHLAAGRGVVIAMLCTGAMASLGMWLSAVELERRAMPVPRADITAQMRGIVLATDLNRSGSPRYLIRPLAIEGLRTTELPDRIRVSGNRSSPANATGSALSGLVRLRPLPAPYYPGGYDFAYHGWLEGLGLTGFFMGKTVSNAPPSVEPDWWTHFMIFQNRIREKIAGRIRSGLEGQPGHVAVALVTGDRSGLSEQTQESLRRSGLAHILAISGLHMALVTLTVIWLVRQSLVFIPGLAERHAIKKWAVGAGFAAATLYLFLAGAGVATQRAWIMLSVMMLAALLDRQAITMRSVAIAALIVLAIAPSSLFQPGFQMSFAAVSALVAAYRQWTDWQADRARRAEHHWQAPGIGRKVIGYFAGLTATSLIAGLATALFAAWHFHRIVPLGIAANLLAMPVVSLAVMPLCLLAMLLMPYGFETLALKPLGQAIEAVLGISDMVIGHHPGLETGLLPPQLPLLGALALVLACGLRSRLRLIAVLPMAVIAAITGAGQSATGMPDLLIAQNGSAIAVRQQAAENTGSYEKAALAIVNPEANRFATEIWRRAYLPNVRFSEFWAEEPCGKDICRFRAAQMKVSLVYDPELLAAECNRADILLAPRLWFVRCKQRKPALIVTRSDLEQAGSHAIFIEGNSMRTVTTWPSPAEIGAGRRQFSWQKRFDNVSRRFAENTAP